MADVIERTPAGGERSGAQGSTADLIRQATEQVSKLVRDEMALARAEIATKGKQAGIGAGLLGGGGLFALYALAALLAAAILGIAVVLPAWLAALIIGAGLLLLSGAMALVGRGRVARGVPPVPRDTVQRVRSDIDEVRERIHR